MSERPSSFFFLLYVCAPLLVRYTPLQSFTPLADSLAAVYLLLQSLSREFRNQNNARSLGFRPFALTIALGSMIPPRVRRYAVT
jgi:hypothetical protein